MAEYRIPIQSLDVKHIKNALLEDDLLQVIAERAQGDRAEINNITVDDVSFLDNNAIAINFSYTWNTYYGCSDMNNAGQEFDMLEFSVENDGSTLVYDLPEERTTLDEI
jgi:hypothetical protein